MSNASHLDQEVPPGGHGASAPVVAGFFHGILTGRTDETWPEKFRNQLRALLPGSFATTTVYEEGPFPRRAAIRNRRRIPRLVREIIADYEHATWRDGVEPPIFLFGHSNGGVLVMLVAERLIHLGYRIEGIFLMAPAVRSVKTTRQLAEWMTKEKLGDACLLMATKDRVLSLVSHLRISTWPWGALGVEGWPTEEIPEDLSSRFGTIELEVGHGDFLRPGIDRANTWDRFIAPFILDRARRKEAA